MQRQAQVNHRGIQTDQFVLEPKLPRADDLGRNRLKQAVKDLLEQFPRPVRIGIGQRGPRRSVDAEVEKLAFAALQPPFDLP